VVQRACPGTGNQEDTLVVVLPNDATPGWCLVADVRGPQAVSCLELDFDARLSAELR
jgi:hypothetical protein